jgi:hypothetical protein
MGLFGLGQTWCGGSGPVPASEMQAVSACLFARLNAAGKHNVLSIRGYENSLALGDNEQLFMAYLSTRNWGHLWDLTTNITDTSDLSTYTRAKAYGCYFPWGNAEAQLAQDLQILLGRTFEWSTTGPLKSTLACLVPGTPTWLGGDGSTSTGMPGTTPDPVVDTATVGPTSTNWSTYPSPWDADEYVKWRGNYWRQITTYLGAWADLEDSNWKDAAYQCNNACPGAIPGGGYYSFSSCSPNGGGGLPNGGGGGEGQGSASGYRGGCASPDPRCEHPTVWNICQTKVYSGVIGAVSADCTPKSQCVAGRKLVSMPPGQWLRVEFTRPYRYNFTTANWDLNIGTVNPHLAGTLAFHYSNGSPGNAGILIQDRLRSFAVTPVTDFPPTGGDDNYAVHTVYPWYPVAPSSPSSGELGVDIDIGSGAGTFPHLDYVQMWVGPPIGGKSQELWWNSEPVDLEQGTVCVNVEVESSSGISAVSGVRVRPQVHGAKLQDLQVSLRHGDVTHAPRRFDSATSWSEWSPRFSGQNPQQGAWELCVTSPSAGGTLERVDIEMKQR